MLLTTQGLCYAAPKASSCFSHATLRLGRGLICQALSSQANTSALKLLPALPPSLPPSLRFPPPLILLDIRGTLRCCWQMSWAGCHDEFDCIASVIVLLQHWPLCVLPNSSYSALHCKYFSFVVLSQSHYKSLWFFFLGGGGDGTRSKSVKGSESPREE